MRPVPIALCLIGVAALQATAIWDRPQAPVRPDLLLLLSIAFALGFPLRRAIGVALAAGLLRDLYSVAPLGTATLSFCLVACVISAVRDEIYRAHPLTHILLTACVAWVPIAVALTPIALGDGVAAALPILRRSPWFVAQTALFAPLVIVPVLAAAPIWAERPSNLAAPPG